jgi:hypothetical protein
MTLIIYSLLCAAMFYLGSRAKITDWLWSRYPRKLAGFMDCAACTGFWWGVVWSVVLPFDISGLGWMAPGVTGLCMVVLTPIAAGLMQVALDHLGSVQVDP